MVHQLFAWLNDKTDRTTKKQIDKHRACYRTLVWSPSHVYTRNSRDLYNDFDTKSSNCFVIRSRTYKAWRKGAKVGRGEYSTSIPYISARISEPSLDYIFRSPYCHSLYVTAAFYFLCQALSFDFLTFLCLLLPPSLLLNTWQYSVPSTNFILITIKL